jgi:hypothetical protein
MIVQIAAIPGFMLTLSQTRTARSSGKRERFRGMQMGKMLLRRAAIFEWAFALDYR